MKLYLSLITTLLFIIFSTTACGGGEADQNEQPEVQQNTAESDELSQFELDNGIGPITEEIEISDEIDREKAKRGFETYDMKCAACHRMETRLVGPPLADITERRSPEFIMNFILNPVENTRKHPVGQELLQEYMMQMTFQDVSEEEAREILEYFRHVNETGQEVL
ncbi:MAG: cytochrome c [Balneolales bacterium]